MPLSFLHELVVHNPAAHDVLASMLFVSGSSLQAPSLLQTVLSEPVPISLTSSHN
jgi:hypothetical protein